MKIGITGSSGSLGRALLKRISVNKIFRFKGRLENKKEITEWIKKNSFDCVIHLAAIVPVTIVNNDKKKAFNVNYIGTKNLIDSIKKHSKKKIWFFYSSTSHVYKVGNIKKKEIEKTNASTYYGKTKELSEKYILRNKKYLSVCVGRIFSYTSKTQKNYYLIPNLINKLKIKKKNVVFKNLNHYRDFLSIEDITTAIKILLKKKATGIYNICSGKKIHLAHLVKTINKNYKKNLKFSSNSKSTSLIGDNRKLKKIGWISKNSNYLKYIENYSK